MSFGYYKIVKCRVVNCTESNGLNRIFVNKRNGGKGLEHLFITSKCSHFFNKTDFEQFLFKDNKVNNFKSLTQIYFRLCIGLFSLLFLLVDKPFSQRAIAMHLRSHLLKLAAISQNARWQ